MKVTPTALPEVLIIQPQVFTDERGYFLESWNAQRFKQATGVQAEFVQDNQSRSVRNVLRGLHYQVIRPQGKLVRCVSGKSWHVAIDLRKSSPRFKQWVGLELAGADHRQLWIPPGFGHGFIVLSDQADTLYKVTEYWIAEYDRSVRWNDPALGVVWPFTPAQPQLSSKDSAAPMLTDAEVFP